MLGRVVGCRLEDILRYYGCFFVGHLSCINMGVLDARPGL
jgi:hypothetical protein